MAELLRLWCECGYEVEVADGGLFAGVVDLYVCRDCDAVVGVLTWSSGYRGEEPGAVEPVCPGAKAPTSPSGARRVAAAVRARVVCAR